MKFTKMHGCSNDYIYVNCFEETVADMGVFAKEFSDRHKGIGSDGAIFICPSEEADCEMKMYNADGSYSEMCGNGIRCVAKYVYDNAIVDKKDMNILSGGQIKKIRVEVGDERVNDVTGKSFSKRKDGLAVNKVRVDMGEPILEPYRIPAMFSDGCDAIIAHDLYVGDANYKATCVSMGNPHCVIKVQEVDRIPVETLGPQFENHVCFPNRACGTGACATVVACVLNGETDEKVTVHLLGGDLEVFWDRSGDNHVYMTGGAVTVFEGEV